MTIRHSTAALRPARLRPPGRLTTRRVASAVAGAALALVLLPGCGGEGADTSCGLDQCTVTFARGAAGSASILGVEAKLVGVENDQVTLEVAGERLSLTVGQQAADVGGLAVSVQSVTDSEVIVQIAR